MSSKITTEAFKKLSRIDIRYWSTINRRSAFKSLFYTLRNIGYVKHTGWYTSVLHRYCEAYGDNRYEQVRYLSKAKERVRNKVLKDSRVL